jgi:hypothetical protein
MEKYGNLDRDETLTFVGYYHIALAKNKYFLSLHNDRYALLGPGIRSERLTHKAANTFPCDR